MGKDNMNDLFESMLLSKKQSTRIKGGEPSNPSLSECCIFQNCKTDCNTSCTICVTTCVDCVSDCATKCQIYDCTSDNMYYW